MEIVPVHVKASSEGKYEGKIRRAKTVIDNNDLTFWYTDKTLPQYLEFTFNEVIQFDTISIMFQGGFASEDVIIYTSTNNTDFSKLGDCFYVEDINTEQILSIPPTKASSIRLEFSKAFDMYHRIIVYSVKFFNKS